VRRSGLGHDSKRHLPFHRRLIVKLSTVAELRRSRRFISVNPPTEDRYFQEM